MRVHSTSQIRYMVFCSFALIPLLVLAQREQHLGVAELHARIDLPARQMKEHAPAAVLWLKAISSTTTSQSLPPGHFTLVQKNRMFIPHMLVVPVGSVVTFPNADPFFHNVFSLFNGKRFDLGLYEAGKSKDVVFSREGVSYIFCNIHPEIGVFT
jgi:plastocyanin